MIHKHFLTTLLLLTGLLQTAESRASNPQPDQPEDFSWNLTLGVALVSNPTHIAGAEQYEAKHYWGVQASLDLYYKGFFLQTNKHRFDGFMTGSELGYELIVEDEYEIDLISKSYLVGFDENNAGLVRDESIPELEGIKSRGVGSNQGVRYIRYLDDAVYWVDVATDLFNNKHDGFVVDGFYSRILPIRNWDISLGVGATYFSEDINNYYFSVSEYEAREFRPVYDAGDGYRIELEASAQKPVWEDWLFSAGVTLSHFSDSIADSPLVARQNVLRFQVGISYVF